LITLRTVLRLDVELYGRVVGFVFFAVVAAVAIQIFGLPPQILTTGAELFTSFIISGGLYALLAASGFEFLEEFKLKYSISAMTVVVFLLGQPLV